jgi:isoquinoline 1-oxidoreductase beta subunit
MMTSRRAFLKKTALGSASLIIGFNGSRILAHDSSSELKPNGWIKIDRDGAVTLTIGKSEMGQGVRTSLAMMLADELGADWSRIKLIQARPGPAPFDDLGTGGSGSMEDGWAMRRAAAAAREMLVGAAAARWQISPNECKTERGAVEHETKGRLEFGALVDDAAKLPVPKDPKLKAKADYKIIGQRTARIDGHDIVTGGAHYGIDTKVPGMLCVSVERPPFTGAKPEEMDEKKARAVRGVSSVLRGDFGVAVAAEKNFS